jgi:hypothetical protein
VGQADERAERERCGRGRLVLTGRGVGVVVTRSGDELVTSDLAALVHEECQGAQSHIVVAVHSWPGRISLVLGDVDRSEVAVGDILSFLVACPEPAYGGRFSALTGRAIADSFRSPVLWR